MLSHLPQSPHWIMALSKDQEQWVLQLRALLAAHAKGDEQPVHVGAPWLIALGSY
jgi:hypothetical protein